MVEHCIPGGVVAGLQNGTTTKVVRTLPEEVQERLLEFRQIGELGWRHKEEETRKKMIRYWTEEVVEDQTSYTEGNEEEVVQQCGAESGSEQTQYVVDRRRGCGQTRSGPAAAGRRG